MEGAYGGQGPKPVKKLKVADEKLAYKALTPQQLAQRIKFLEKDMREAAKQLAFEKAAQVRDEILTLKQQLVIR